jgi:hypothetical protein
LPPGAMLSGRAPRVHFRFAPNGQVANDEALFIRDGVLTASVPIDRWTGEVRSGAR